MYHVTAPATSEAVRRLVLSSMPERRAVRLSLREVGVDIPAAMPVTSVDIVVRTTRHKANGSMTVLADSSDFRDIVLETGPDPVQPARVSLVFR